MINHRKYTVSLYISLAGAIVSLLLSPICIAWCAPDSPNTVDPAPALDTDPFLRTAQIEKDTALQVKVAFTTTRLPLGDLLSDLQKRSGVILLAGANSPASTAFITANVSDLPLSQVMLGISRLYGVRWMKSSANIFTMYASDKGDLEIGLMQLGDIEGFRNRYISSLASRPNVLQWPKEVMKYVDEKNLRENRKTPASALPTELLKSIREEKEKLAGLQLLVDHHKAMEASIDGYVLHAEFTNGGATIDGVAVPAFPQITILTKNGRDVAALNRPRLLPQPKVRVHSAPPQEPEPPRPG
jgi:hypothetical protein